MNIRVWPIIRAAVLLVVFIGTWVPARCLSNLQGKSRVATFNGAKTVLNQEEPLYGDLKLELTEDLRIGRADDENYLFQDIQDIAIDLEGNIFVLDMRNYRIQKFDIEGKYLMTIGRRGQGPGEFEFPTRIRLASNNGNIAVLDRGVSIEYFGPDGKPIKSVRLDLPCSDFHLAPSGSIFAVGNRRTDNEAFQSFREIDEKGRILKTVAEFPQTLFVRKKENSILTIRTGHELSLQTAMIGEKSIVYGHSKKYELVVEDFKGNILYRIVTNAPIPEYSDEEKNGFTKIPVPKEKPYFYAFFVDDKERLYVQRNMADMRSDDDTKKVIDIYGKDGAFLYKTEMPKKTILIKNGYLYSYENEDIETVIRSKILNWDKIKVSADANINDNP